MQICGDPIINALEFIQFWTKPSHEISIFSVASYIIYIYIFTRWDHKYHVDKTSQKPQIIDNNTSLFGFLDIERNTFIKDIHMTNVWATVS